MADPSVDYDVVHTFDVYPMDIKNRAATVIVQNKDIVDSLKRILDILDDLALGWAGKTSQEVSDVTHRWNQVSTELFGPPSQGDKAADEDKDSKKPPTPEELGVLNLIAGGLSAASDVFAITEGGIRDYYNGFRQALLSDSANDEAKPTTNIDDVYGTAVGEFW